MCEENFQNLIECMMKSLKDLIVPAGTIIIRPTADVPESFLECDGAEVSREEYSKLFAVIGTTYGEGDSLTTFNLPDLRGEFVRGWDHGKGVDLERSISSFQADEFKAHTHTYSYRNSSSSDVDDGSGARYGFTSGKTGSTGGSETRPRNIAMMYCIKY